MRRPLFLSEQRITPHPDYSLDTGYNARTGISLKRWENE
jgi:hypothetical protein